MPILTIQRRQHEVGRIRLGQKTAKGAPQKLDRFRLTSSDRTLIEQAASLYGGSPQHWDGAPIGDQWEVITDAQEMTVIVPPGPFVLTQFFETWSGGGCVRRCDGETEMISGDPCHCAQEDQQTCKPTTRLSVMLAELPGIGVWRLESHGFYAATELAGTVDVLQAAAGHGQLLPAVLRLEQRQVKKPGEATRNFVVPVLEIRVTPTGLGVGRPVAIDSDGWAPIATPEPAGALTAGEAAAAVATPGKPPKQQRANSAPPVPSTGVKPRGNAGTTDQTEPASVAQVKAIQSMFGMIAKRTGEAFDDNRKHAAAANILGRAELASFNDLDKTDASRVIDALNDVNADRITIDGTQLAPAAGLPLDAA